MMNKLNNDKFLDLALEHSIHGRPDESERILKECEDQNDARVVFNLGWHEIRHGNLNTGMRMLDAGRFINVYGLPPIPGKIWKDEDLKDKILLFRTEGGLGDQIIQIRFVKDFEKLGAKVVVSCIPEIKSFFSNNGYICIDNEAVLGLHYDYWVPAKSAAHLLGYDQDTLPNSKYLKSSYKKELWSKPDTLKVGIKWAGNPKFEHEQHRRFDPQPLIDLHTLDGVTLYSLQKEDVLVDGLPFADLRDQMKTWDDTAAIIEDLDLVITSCTSIAHCAAAMGKETWVIVPILPYYTWAYPGEKSFWYNSVKLFRQTKYGNWDEPLINVRQALIEKINQSKIGN